MSEEILLAYEYRKHAKALRAAANFDNEARTSLVLKRIAGEYEQMAKGLEGADAMNKAVLQPDKVQDALDRPTTVSSGKPFAKLR